MLKRWRTYRGPLAALLTVATSFWLAWAILSNTAADTNAGGAPERALAWDSGHPAALLHMAEQQLASGLPQDAVAAANLAGRPCCVSR